MCKYYTSNYYTIDIILNALPSSQIKLKYYAYISLEITHPIVICTHISNACNLDFHLFIVVGDKLISSISPYVQVMFKGKHLCFVKKASIITSFRVGYIRGSWGTHANH